MPAFSFFSYRPLKRLLDCFAAAFLLIVMAPLMAGLSVLILIDSGSPILFRQTRSGYKGDLFNLFKFRTLHSEKHNPATPQQHVTRVGRVLRRWGLDELPQLWNVMRGEMSLVGPRPTLPEQVARYTDKERRRLAVLPGLTGWAQIHGRNTLTWPDRIVLDCWYVENMSFWLDFYILCKTPALLISGTGTYGPKGYNMDFRTEDHVAPPKTPS
ncbi:MAG TPA: sugar transferase [Rhodothermales bacterium]|nr:sugar transferase [Rhodothermales bacterium]